MIYKILFKMQRVRPNEKKEEEDFCSMTHENKKKKHEWPRQLLKQLQASRHINMIKIR